MNRLLIVLMTVSTSFVKIYGMCINTHTHTQIGSLLELSKFIAFGVEKISICDMQQYYGNEYTKFWFYVFSI